MVKEVVGEDNGVVHFLFRLTRGKEIREVPFVYAPNLVRMLLLAMRGKLKKLYLHVNK